MSTGTAWWVTLAAGAVVLVVVLLLLEVLRRSVNSLEDAAHRVLLAGGRVAQNTWSCSLLLGTKLRSDDLCAALRQHLDEVEGSKS